ncbi:MAG: hypothetical protein JWR10_3223 [Rubritepida sp.]|nr:hypothetical protein [Rubritepida sp.]
MRLSRRTALAALAAVPLAAWGARADEAGWPTRPIRLVAPYAPGGTVDIVARLLAAELGPILGQTVMVENRPGGAAVLGTEAVARAAPDGHSFVLVDMSHAIVPAVQAAGGYSIPYDPIGDFTPVTLAAVSPQALLVKSTLAAQNIAELVSLARSRPNGLSFGNGGVGAVSHLMAGLLRLRTGIPIVDIPYRGSGPVVQDLAAGTLDAAFSPIATACSLIEDGKLRILAISGEGRLESYPDVPTFREQGVDIVVEHWFGVLGPAGVPEPVVARLHAVIARAETSATIQRRFDQLSLLPAATGPQAFADLIRTELRRWDEVVRLTGVRPV